MIKLPDVEALLQSLTAQVVGSVRDNTALIGIHTGGVWLAERLHRDLGLESLP